MGLRPAGSWGVAGTGGPESMRQLGRMAFALTTVTVILGLLSGCGAPAYVYVGDTSDQSYFQIPSSWPEVNPHSLADAQQAVLNGSAAGPSGGSFDWSRAYSAVADNGAVDVFTAAPQPVVYSSVQTLGTALRQDLSFDEMRDLLFPVTSQARKQAAADGSTLTGFTALNSHVITDKDGVRGINELFEYTVNGLPDAFDLTVLTNSQTTKLYLLLVQCFQDCFTAHLAQIKQVVSSFVVRGS
jgi:hypothetical protein